MRCLKGGIRGILRIVGVVLNPPLKKEYIGGFALARFGKIPPPPLRLCHKGENAKNVMLNLFQHLIKSNAYETLKQVQGDKKTIVTQSLKGEESFLEN